MKIKKIEKLGLKKVTIVSLNNDIMDEVKAGKIRETLSCTQASECNSWEGCNTYGWCTIPKY